MAAEGRLIAVQQDDVVAPETSHVSANTATDALLDVPVGVDVRGDIADLESDVAYLRRQVHGLRSRLHGELGVLALRIEDNERRAMRRRMVVRRWGMAAVVATWLCVGPSAITRMLDGPFLQPGLLLVGMTFFGGVALVVLILHNTADEEDHTDRHRNWFRLTTRDDP